jgi:hypothetical protein
MVLSGSDKTGGGVVLGFESFILAAAEENPYARRPFKNLPLR